MKICCLVIVAVSGSSLGPNRNPEGNNRKDTRRYADLLAMTKKVWKEHGNGETFDQRKYWGYGCHCIFPTDRPMSEMGHGQAVDGIDTICHQWKLCQKCVREKQGDECIGESYKYQWQWKRRTKRVEIISNPGSCERELGECDRQFAYDLFAKHDEYEERNNYFFGDFNRHDDDSCPRNPGTSTHDCCGGWNAPYEWFNVDKQQCCAVGKTGIVKSLNKQC